MAGERGGLPPLPWAGETVATAMDVAQLYGLPQPAAGQLVTKIMQVIAEAATGVSHLRTRPASDLVTWLADLAAEAKLYDDTH